MISLISCTSPLKIRSEISGELSMISIAGDAALAVAHRHQALRDHRAQVQRQVHQQLLAPLFGEEVDDAVERLVGAVGVQRGHAQVAGLGEGDRVSIVSRSRISPIRITSGAWRSVFFSALPSSRCRCRPRAG
jgi:hypothetical protein